jgi:hypothetical protein
MLTGHVLIAFAVPIVGLIVDGTRDINLGLLSRQVNFDRIGYLTNSIINQTWDNRWRQLRHASWLQDT